MSSRMDFSVGTMWAGYYNEVRTHLSLGKDAPISRPIARFGRIIAEPVVGGLHHRYARIVVFGRDTRNAARAAATTSRSDPAMQFRLFAKNRNRQ